MSASESEIKVQGMYVAYYGRRGEPEGVEFWTGVLDDANGDVSAIVNAFGNSKEYLEGVGTGTTTEQVTALFQQMFDRDPEEEGLNFWVGVIDNGVKTFAEVALAIAEGAQGNDKITYEAKVVTATYFTDVEEMYVAYYGRAGDPGGVEAWTVALDASGGNMDSIINSFGNSQEYLNGIGTGTTTEQVIALYQQMFNRNPEQAGLDFWVGVIDNGVKTLGEVALTIAQSAGSKDRQALDNKIEAASYFTDRVAATGVDYVGADIPAAQAVISAVDTYPVNITYAKFSTDAWIAIPGPDQNLTAGVDTLTGTLGDEIVNGVISTGGDTVTPGDTFDGGDGTDTLKINTDLQNLSLVNTISVKDVEKLQVVNSANNWNSINIAGLDFDEITLDEGGKASGGLDVNNVNASTIVALTNIKGNQSNHNVNFTSDATSSVGNTTIEVSNVNITSNREDFDSRAAFSAAETVYTTVSLLNVNDGNNQHDVTYEHRLDTGDINGVAVNATFNIENVRSNAQFGDYAALYVNQAGGSVNNIIVNMSNTNNTFVWMAIDDGPNGGFGAGRGTSSKDVVTLNLDNVDNSKGNTGFGTTDAETFNLNVVSNSSIGFLSNHINNDGSSMGDGTVNLSAGADLTVRFWNFSDTAGDNTTLNITGSGHVTINELDDNGGGNIVVDAATATGDISLSSLGDGVASVTTGSGNDSIVFDANPNHTFSSLIQTNGGADNIGVARVDATVRYVSATDSQLELTNNQMSGFDVISSFLSGSDIVELSSSLGLATSGLLQKGGIGGTTPAAMKVFIGDGLNFFGGQATAFADDGINGYLYVDANNDGNFTETDDMMIQLAGVKTLGVEDIQFG